MNKKYKIEKINVGNKISYRNKYLKSGYATAIVIEKMHGSLLLIEKTNEKTGERIIIDVSEVFDVKDISTELPKLTK